MICIYDGIHVYKNRDWVESNFVLHVIQFPYILSLFQPRIENPIPTMKKQYKSINDTYSKHKYICSYIDSLGCVGTPPDKSRGFLVFEVLWTSSISFLVLPFFIVFLIRNRSCDMVALYY